MVVVLIMVKLREDYFLNLVQDFIQAMVEVPLSDMSYLHHDHLLELLLSVVYSMHLLCVPIQYLMTCICFMCSDMTLQQNRIDNQV